MGDHAVAMDSDPLAVEGFEELLAEQVPGSAQGCARRPIDSEEAQPSLALEVPVDEAARRLGISTNAALKRLRKGKLKGRKVSGQFGEQWLVDVSAVPEQIEIELEAEPSLAQGSAQTSEGAKPSSAEGSASERLDRESELLQLVIQLSKENGALQALLTEREHQIKLLTDSQHKPGWWRRTWSWFIGSNK